MINVLFAAGANRWPAYAHTLPAALAEAGLQAHVARDIAPDQVDYIVFAPNGTIEDFSPYTRTKAVMNLWAGVERITGNPTLTQPLTRMVDSGLREGMRDWVMGHVLRHHLGMDAHIHGQDGTWGHGDVPPLARDRRVTILGLGELGQTCATALAALGFDVTGWSRSPRDIPGVRCLSGPEGLQTALTGAEIVVLLLPKTPQTENTLDATRLSWVAHGAFVLNPGRGALIDDDALLHALHSGQIAHATLDVFRTEPLPPDHPYWSDPKVTVTPHIASETRPETASQVIAENIRRAEAGAPLLYLVDRQRGY